MPFKIFEYDPLCGEEWEIEAHDDEIVAKNRVFDLYLEAKSRYYNIPEELSSFRYEEIK